MVTLEIWASQGQQEIQVLLASKDNQDLVVLKEILELQEQLVNQVIQVCREIKVQAAHLGSQVQMDSMELQEREETQDHQGTVVAQDLLDLLVFRDRMDRQGHSDQTVFQVVQGFQEILDLLDCLDLQDRLETLVL